MPVLNFNGQYCDYKEKGQACLSILSLLMVASCDIMYCFWLV